MRVGVRPARESDREATSEAANDPLIWEQHSDRDRYTRPVFDRFFDGALACGGGLAILLTLSLLEVPQSVPPSPPTEVHEIAILGGR